MRGGVGVVRVGGGGCEGWRGGRVEERRKRRCVLRFVQFVPLIVQSCPQLSRDSINPSKGRA